MKEFFIKHKVSLSACIAMAFLGVGVYFVFGQATHTSIGNNIHTAGNLTVDGNVGIGTTTPAAKLDVDGYIKSTVPAFSVWQDNVDPRSAAGDTVTYDSTILNNGGNMDLGTGLFTAPIAGIYHFTFNTFRQQNTGTASVVFILNGIEQKQRSYDSDASGDYSPLSLATTRKMEAGDTIGVYVRQGELHGSNNTEFTGFLVTAE